MKRKLTLVLTVLIALGLQQANAQANTKLSNLVAPTAVNQTLLPNGNNTRDLGSASKSWRAFYLDSAIYLKDSLFINSIGDYNTFIGLKAGNSTTSGNQNTGGGWHALGANTTGYQNTAFGLAALFSNTTGNDNTAVGKSTLYYNNGSWNTGLGFQALLNNTGGNGNTATGGYSLFINNTGSYNTATGYNALRVNSIGVYNTAIGYNAGSGNDQGGNNIFIGANAGATNVNGSNNVYLGYNAGGAANISNSIGIGANVNATQSNTIILGNGQKVGIGINNPSAQLYVLSQNETTATYSASNAASGFGVFGQGNAANSTGVLGEADNGTLAYGIWGKSTSGFAGYFNGNVHATGGYSLASDQKLKENIKPVENMLNKIMMLKPSSYNFKKEYSKMNLPKGEQMGFIAQDMEKVFPQLVNTVAEKQSDNEKIFEYKGVNYIGLIPLLTKAIQEQQEEISELKQEVKTLSDNAALSGNTSAAKTVNVSDAALSQNIPNPFSSTTTIQYNLPVHFKTAQLVITDANGAVVKQVILNSAGKGTIDVNAYNLSSGAYTYSLIVDGNTVESKKMIVGK